MLPSLHGIVLPVNCYCFWDEIFRSVGEALHRHWKAFSMGSVAFFLYAICNQG